jgi:putative pyruvate formate lyase activating enzyme
MEDSTRRVFGGGLLGATLLNVNCGPSAAATKQKTMLRKDYEPAYVGLDREGKLAGRANDLYDIYKSCRLCPRGCGANRSKGEKGVCKATARVKIASAHPHFGEERPLVGRGGSGTIFFSNCNLLCDFCQNWNISHGGEGNYYSDDELGRLMVSMQDMGCHNINLVTPTHYVPNIVNALRGAMARGLRVPLVYNCGGYEPVEVIRLLDGIVDIYLPDFKYMDGQAAGRYSNGASDYPEAAATAIEEMNRQVGLLVVDEKGLALRGLMIRHLVMPNNLAGTDRFVKWVAESLGKDTYVNIMAQYRPEYKAKKIPELARRITAMEYAQAQEWARQAGLRNLDQG